MQLDIRTNCVEDGHLRYVESAIRIVWVVLKGDQDFAEPETYDQLGAREDLDPGQCEQAV